MEAGEARGWSGGKDALLGQELRPALDAQIPLAAWTQSTIAFPAGYFWRGNAGSTAVRKAEAASAADGPLPVFYTFREFRSFGKGIMALGCCSDTEEKGYFSSTTILTLKRKKRKPLPTSGSRTSEGAPEDPALRVPCLESFSSFFPPAPFYIFHFDLFSSFSSLSASRTLGYLNILLLSLF